MMYRLVFQVFTPHTNIHGPGFSLVLIKHYISIRRGLYRAIGAMWSISSGFGVRLIIGLVYEILEYVRNCGFGVRVNYIAQTLVRSYFVSKIKGCLDSN